MKKSVVILVLILFLASFLRLWQLGVVPFGMTHDELGYSYNAYSIAKTGKNVFGEKLPLLTWVAKGDAFLPTTMYLTVPFFFFLPFNATTARLPDALLGIADVFLIYILVLSVFKNKQLALLSSFFLAISPWHLHFSRSGYDINFALFFYLLSVTLFVIEIKKGRPPYFSLMSILLGIFTYRGMSAMAFPLFLSLLLYAKLIKAKKHQITVFAAGGFVVFVIFLGVILKVGRENYAPESTSLLNDPKIQQYVDNQSRDAKGPLFLKRIFLNKPMYLLDRFRENYFETYSPGFLFLHTEGRQTYSIWSRGRIYFLDSVFILAGFLYFARKGKKESVLFFLLLLIGGLPVALAGPPISARSFFLSAIFPVFSATGVFFFYDLLRKGKAIFITGIILIYFFLLSSYLFDYYARYAYQGAEAWGKSFKDVSKLIDKNKTKYDKIIWEKVTFGDFIEYSLYSKTQPSDVQKVYKTGYNGTYSFQNIVLSNSCGKPQERAMYIVSSSDCFKDKAPNSTINDFFGNPIWKVYSFK